MAPRRASGSGGVISLLFCWGRQGAGLGLRVTYSRNPQDAVEYIPRISPRSTTTVGAANGIGDRRFEHFPLFVGQVYGPPRLKQINAQPFSFPIRTLWLGILERVCTTPCARVSLDPG